MSYKVVELVYGTDPKILRPAMKRFVLSVLAAYANHDGSEVRPGLPRLAQRCGLSIDAVYRWRRLLRVEGWIVQVAREDRRRNRPAIYRIDLNKLQAAAWKGMVADSAPAQSQGNKSDSALAPKSDSAPAPMKRGSDSALAPKTPGSDSAPAQSNPSFPKTRPKNERSEREAAAPSPSLSSSSEAQGEPKMIGDWEEQELLDMIQDIRNDENDANLMTATDSAIMGTVEARVQAGLPVSKELISNFSGIINKLVDEENRRRRKAAKS